MQDLEGRVAVVTGAASGIGEALARATARAGMKVVLADIEGARAEQVAEGIRKDGGEALGFACDVSDRHSVERLADATWDGFGGAHLLCNNAGVLAQGPLVDASDADWHWLIGVNVFGVLNGVRTFVPRMRAASSEAHIVNTSSISGLTAIPNLGVYSATKHAIVAISDVLASELAEDGIGVSVLCPGAVETAIDDSARNRPQALGGPGREDPSTGTDEEAAIGEFDDGLSEVLAPNELAELVLEAVRHGELYVMTHPAWKAPLGARAELIAAACDRAAERRRGSG